MIDCSDSQPTPFMPSDRYPYLKGTGDIEADLWLRPNPQLQGVLDIMRYGLTVDGYGYASQVLGRNLFDMADELERRCTGSARESATFLELRLWLFARLAPVFIQWADALLNKNEDLDPNLASTAQDLRDLNRALCDAWERDRPRRPSGNHS